MTGADFGLVISCTVTAVNVVGSANANSSNTKGPIIAAPPAEVLTDEEGTTLTVDGDSTDGDRMTDVIIPGATTSTRTLVTATSGKILFCRVQGDQCVWL